MTVQPALRPIIGSQIGNWRVLREIGSGAMGEVFLAEHPQIGSKVAIKILAPHLWANPEMGNRFMSQARAANRINHPNIIQTFDFGRLEDGRLYLVMEYLSGQELTEHVRAHAPLPLGEVAKLLRQITSAMGAAHEVGIIHRDLKPDNIPRRETLVARQDASMDLSLTQWVRLRRHRRRGVLRPRRRRGRHPVGEGTLRPD